MKVLVIGSGGREHALAWRLAQSPRVQRVYVAPGNGGTALEERVENVPLTTISQLLRFAADETIHATIVGPEAPLAEGIVDAFRAVNLRIFGPTRAAAQLESSKDFAKRFMLRHAIPTARFMAFDNSRDAHAYVDTQAVPIVIKADGLANGKGVVIAESPETAHATIDRMLGIADAGGRIVIEEFLEGEEASFIVMSDGVHALPMATSQDHKRLLDGDQGPNTGGMGAYSPALVVTPTIHARVMREVIMPTIAGMAQEGIPYTGFLYAGLMITGNGSIKVLEFNCRLGDPESQPILLRLKTDLTALVNAAIDGTLDKIGVDWDRRMALGVVMAAAGYPGEPKRGDVIHGLPKTGGAPADDSHIFHAGTTIKDGQVVTQGGRVLCVTALGDNVRAAQKYAYELAERIRFDGMQFRRDIGYRALQHKNK